MLISMNWIRDFVNLDGLDLRELIGRFTLATAEVEEIIAYDSDVRGVVVGKVLSVDPHPKSKKLHLLQVDDGSGAPVDCVCGAPNVRPGMTVAFARIGGRAGGLDIAEVEIAGARSCGMCCSEKELGLSDDHGGIMDLPASLTAGTPVERLFELTDLVFEVDNKSLTNRPDLWGHYGIAREFAALTGRPLAAVPQWQPADPEPLAALPELPVEIRDSQRCLRYTAFAADGVSLAASPLLIQVRLRRCGLRAINWLTDLTNYVMLELGQPMHAFDRRKVDRIEVQCFPQPFTFRTLDEVDRPIDPETLMICSNEKPVAIAGIMGGLDSAIADDTTQLFLESASFDGVGVRRSSMRLGLRTDASQRFEKMLDPELAPLAVGRYLELLFRYDLNARPASRITDRHERSYPPIQLTIDQSYIDRYAGIPIPGERVGATLRSLGFGVTEQAGVFTVDVPSWRRTKDVSIKADLIEEITRIYGYDNIPMQTTLSPLIPARPDRGLRDERRITTLLADRFALHEVHTYVWNDARKFRALGLAMEDNVKLTNSLSTDLTVLRRSLVPSLLAVLQENRQYAGQFGVFEIGSAVAGQRTDGTCDERRRLAVALFDRDGDPQAAFDRCNELVRALGQALRGYEPAFAPADRASLAAWWHPRNTATVTLDGRLLGLAGLLHPSVQKKIDRKAAIWLIELDLQELDEIVPLPLVFAEPSRFPEIPFELSLVAPADLPFAALERIVRAEPSAILTGLEWLGEFRAAALGDRKSISIRLHFGSHERTLASEEVQQEVDRILARFAAAGIELRQ